MKTSSFFLSTLIAAAAMSANAYAADYTVTDSSKTLIDATSEDTVTIDFSSNSNSYLYADNNTSSYTINADVIIANATIHNGYSDKVYTFNGAVTGTGDFYYQADKGSDRQTYVFNGDVSGYSGVMLIASNKTGTITFTNKTGTGTITAEGAKSVINLDGATVNNSAISVSTINISAATTFAANTILTGNVKFTGLTATSSTFDVSIAGLQENVQETYTLNSGTGTISGLTTENVTVNGLTMSSISGNTAVANISVYNVLAGTEANYSDTGVSTANRINVLGTLDLGSVNNISLVGTGDGIIRAQDGNASGHFTIKVGSEFSGKLELSGDVDVGAMEAGKATVAFVGTSNNLWSAGSRIITNDVLFQGATTIHNNSGNLTLNGTVDLTEGATLNANGKTLSIAKLTGSGMIQGTQNLSISSFDDGWSGTVSLDVVAAGSTKTEVDLAKWGKKGSKIVVNGISGDDVYFKGDVDANLEFAGDVVVNDGVSSRTIVFSGDITGSGNFVFSGTRTVGESYLFSGDVSGYSGVFERTTGSTNDTQNRLTFGNGGAGITGTNLNGTQKSVSGTGEIKWASDSSAYQVIYNYSNDVYATNKISGGALVKKGSGSLTLTGDNSYSGGTTIEAGTLVAAHQNALGNGNVTMSGGALRIACDVTAGILMFNSSNVSLELDGALSLSQIALGSTNPTSISIDFGTSGKITTTQELNFGSSVTEFTFTLTLTDDQLNDLNNGDDVSREILLGGGNWGIWNFGDKGTKTISITNWDNSNENYVGAIADTTTLKAGEWGYIYTDTNSQDSVSIYVAGIPEPSAFGLLAGLGAVALCVSRRRRSRR